MIMRNELVGFSDKLEITFHYSDQIVRYETNSSKDSGTMALLVDYLPIIHHYCALQIDWNVFDGCQSSNELEY